jgi:hypothetical protein
MPAARAATATPPTMNCDASAGGSTGAHNPVSPTQPVSRR